MLRVTEVLAPSSMGCMAHAGAGRAPVRGLHLAHERQVRREHARHQRLLVVHAHLANTREAGEPARNRRR